MKLAKEHLEKVTIFDPYTELIVNQAIEKAFFEGMREATGLGLMECKKKYNKEDVGYYHQFFDFLKFKRKNNLV